MKKVFIDGSAGTTGLRIFERITSRDDVELITLPDEVRKDAEARKRAINSADVVFLCLPDDASREAVSFVENENVTIIDASTAHRTLPDWAYGFPELSKKHEEKITSSKRIAVPGCHASGFIALVYPLIENGFLDKDALLTCHSITGYSGGGKKMIAEYEDENRNPLLDAPRQYALGQQHKHLKEMKAVCGLENAPIFCPIVSDFYSGMTVTVPIFASQLKKGGLEEIKALYKEKYTGEFVKYVENVDEGGLLSGLAEAKKDGMKIAVAGNEERILLLASYDNLGKGASGAAIECMNIAIGAERDKGLVL
ncbi:MAG: N-acetyl-gamma-glutamyl-phosphate reductase [Clostridiales bacterium]|nr:N-acetyl-gamma-glutamyl-phosphate reductase [Clostridiales bacterium]